MDVKILNRFQSVDHNILILILLLRHASQNIFSYGVYDYPMLNMLSVPMVIEEQPGGGEKVVQVENGGKLELKCVATGIPRPTYQWYYENSLLAGQSTSSLTISPFR